MVISSRESLVVVEISGKYCYCQCNWQDISQGVARSSFWQGSQRITSGIMSKLSVKCHSGFIRTHTHTGSIERFKITHCPRRGSSRKGTTTKETKQDTAQSWQKVSHVKHFESLEIPSSRERERKNKLTLNPKEGEGKVKVAAARGPCPHIIRPLKAELIIYT